MKEMHDTKFEENERRPAAIVGVYDGVNSTEEACFLSLDELASLADTAGAEVKFRITQERRAPDKRTYIGAGKLSELSFMCRALGVDLIIFDDELTPSQIRNIENAVENEEISPDVIDRSMLILDIFARHAVTGEGKLQVEVAQLKYSAPRLVGHGGEMSRQGAVGGNPIGTRGPGETKLERDRRRVKARISLLENRLAELEATRGTMRAARERSGICRVSIVGYTNAGKSTLLNRLTDAGILAEDKLFATLDPTTRKYKLPSGEELLLTDTVGFIRKLPTHLVSAFKSTLEEAVSADIIMMVIDASDPEYESHIAVTEDILFSLGAEGKPVIYVFNKCDLPAERVPRLPREKSPIYISALSGRGIDNLTDRLTATVRALRRRAVFVFPPEASSQLSRFYRSAAILNTEYLEDGSVKVTANASGEIIGRYREFIAAKEKQ
ncbi:MAG: GTPase HflX [Firmicutes bacterium]|nr:GTPase HflX [Bacillota bacterium]